MATGSASTRRSGKNKGAGQLDNNSNIRRAVKTRSTTVKKKPSIIASKFHCPSDSDSYDEDYSQQQGMM